MALDLGSSDVSELLRSGTAARSAGAGHATLEAAARALARCFYDELQVAGPTGPTRACALVRCYKTHPYGTLPADLQRDALAGLGPGEHPAPGMRCVTLLSSAGGEAAWTSRRDSGGRRAVPLPDSDAVARWPMIERLVRDFGLEPADLVEPPAAGVRLRRGRNFGVFHVEEALGSPVIPAQETFVRRHGIRSVVGFGGSLSTGDVFAVVLFCRVHVPPAVAEQFRALALHVKSALFAFADRDAFDAAPASSGGALATGAPS